MLSNVRFRPPNNNNTSGFSLVEVLISLVVLSIGLLGVAALQASATRYNNSGQLRSIAAYQAYNMIDRIRVNKAGADAGSYNNISGLGGDPGCGTCSAAQIAQKDQFEWNTANAQLLPQGQGTVTRAGNVYTITIYWDNHRTGATGLNCGADNTVDLTCLHVSTEL